MTGNAIIMQDKELPLRVISDLLVMSDVGGYSNLLLLDLSRCG